MTENDHPEDQRRGQEDWMPEAGTVIASMIHTAVHVLDERGCRPEIRGVAEDIGIDQLTVQMFESFERSDFPTLDALVAADEESDPRIDLQDIKGNALQLLSAALTAKSRLKEIGFRSSGVDLDAMVWALIQAGGAHSRVSALLDVKFDRDLTKLRQMPGQTKGRALAKAGREQRDQFIAGVDRKFVASRTKNGGPKPPRTERARHVSRELKRGSHNGADLSVKRIKDILRERS